jgi:hypothetical protein
MPAPVLPINQSLETLLDEMFYTASALSADAEAATYAAAFDDFLKKQWQPVAERERALRGGVLRAQAQVAGLDRRLDAWLDRFHGTLLLITGNRRDVPQYQRYFGSQPPSLLKRPVLGVQLATLAAWVPSIKGAADPTLAALGKELEALVAEGQQAEAGLDAARGLVKDFREVGARKALFDGANALRQATFGELSSYVHDHPEKNLSLDWASGFFRHDARERLSTEGELSRLSAEIEERESDLQAARARHAELLAQQAAAAAQARERRAAEERLQALEAEARAKEAEAQALRDSLGAPKGRRKPSRRRPS